MTTGEAGCLNGRGDGGEPQAAAPADLSVQFFEINDLRFAVCVLRATALND